MPTKSVRIHIIVRHKIYFNVIYSWNGIVMQCSFAKTIDTILSYVL